MVNKIQGTVARRNFPPIFDLIFKHFLFVPVTALKVKVLSRDECLGDADGAQREGIAQEIRRLPIDLTSHDSGRIADGLLQSYCRGTTI